MTAVPLTPGVLILCTAIDSGDLGALPALADALEECGAGELAALARTPDAQLVVDASGVRSAVPPCVVCGAAYASRYFCSACAERKREFLDRCPCACGRAAPAERGHGVIDDGSRRWNIRSGEICCDGCRDD